MIAPALPKAPQNARRALSWAPVGLPTTSTNASGVREVQSIFLWFFIVLWLALIKWMLWFESCSLSQQFPFFSEVFGLRMWVGNCPSFPCVSRWPIVASVRRDANRPDMRGGRAFYLSGRFLSCRMWSVLASVLENSAAETEETALFLPVMRQVFALFQKACRC